MSTSSRPRVDEFLLALLWAISSLVWLYFGLTGYTANFIAVGSLVLPRFILSYFLLCMAVFGLRYAIYVFARIVGRIPGWMNTSGPLMLGLVLVAGSAFSIFTLVFVVADLVTQPKTNLVFAWGFTAASAILLLAIIQLLAAVNAFEPFIVGRLPDGALQKNPRWLVALTWLNGLQRNFSSSSRAKRRNSILPRGPLLTEADLKTNVIVEKVGGRPGLERTLVAHGGWHITALGYTDDPNVIFAASDGGYIHYQAGGRKGTLFPPEIKFWEWRSGRVQTASLGLVQTFLTQDYQKPANLQNSRFLVPGGGGKFAWVTRHNIRIGEWQSDKVLSLDPDEPLLLKNRHGFSPLTFSYDGSKFAWCNADGSVRSWNLDDNRVQPLRAYTTDSGKLTSDEDDTAWGVAFSPDGTKLATIGGRGVMLQNVYTGWRWMAGNNPRSERPTAFAFNHSGFSMAVGLLARPSDAAEGIDISAWQPIIRLWDLKQADSVDLTAGTTPLREMSFSHDNKLLAAVDEAGLLWLWDVLPDDFATKPPQLVAQLDLGLTGRKIVIAFAPDLERLICATDNRILVWSLKKVRQEWPVAVS